MQGFFPTEWTGLELAWLGTSTEGYGLPGVLLVDCQKIWAVRLNPDGSGGPPDVERGRLVPPGVLSTPMALRNPHAEAIEVRFTARDGGQTLDEEAVVTLAAGETTGLHRRVRW